MEQRIRDTIIERMRARANTGALNNEADFICGAMTMYLALNPESEKDGSWCPPAWVIHITQNQSLLE